MKLLIVSSEEGQVTDLYKVKDETLDTFLDLHEFVAIDDDDNIPGVSTVARNPSGETIIVLDYPIGRVPNLHIPTNKE